MQLFRLRLYLFIFFTATSLMKLSASTMPFLSGSDSYRIRSFIPLGEEKCGSGENSMDGLTFSDDQTVHSEAHFHILQHRRYIRFAGFIAYSTRYIKPYPPSVPTPPPNFLHV